MKYLIVSDCYYPSKKSISRHIYDLLKKFSIENKNVDFYFPSQVKNKSILNQKYHLKNINYIPINTNDNKSDSFFIRGFNEFLMPFIFWNKIKKNKKIK